MSFTTRLLEKTPLILDGAMGTELSRRGVSIQLPLWSANTLLENPEVVKQVHIDYINAGVDIITTNTFRTDSRTFQKAGLTKMGAYSSTQLAIEIAKSAIDIVSTGRRIWIAGSMSPLEDCYHPELSPDYKTAFEEHKEKALWLSEAGVDFILVETMNTFQEALAATKAALNTGLPVITSFICNSEGNIFNGDDMFKAYLKLKTLKINGFSINCTHHSIISTFLEQYLHRIEIPVAVYANAGFYNKDSGWKDDINFSPENYAQITQNWVAMGVKIAGGCCGTSPEYIHEIAEKLGRL